MIAISVGTTRNPAPPTVVLKQVHVEPNSIVLLPFPHSITLELSLNLNGLLQPP